MAEPLRKAPKPGSDHAGKVKRGDQCLVVGESVDDRGAERVEVQTLDGKRGWLRASAVRNL